MTSESDDDPILDGEDIACLGMRRVDAWSLFPARTDEDWEKLFAALQAAKGKPPKPRKPSIGKLVEQAKAAGVTSVTLPDGTKLDFGNPETAMPENPWLADLRKEAKQ